jgi:hypothetical protein
MEELAMPSAKRSSRAKKAKGKQRSRSIPLRSARDAVHSRKVGKKPARSADAALPGDSLSATLPFGQDALEIGAFATRCASACASLPLRLARCDSPVGLVREQISVAFEIVGDYHSLTRRALHRWLEFARRVR